MPFARRFRPVFEYVAQMRSAARAIDLDAGRPVAIVFLAAHMLGIELAIETRPARTRIELVLARKQRQTANDAGVKTIFMIVEQVSAESGLGPGQQSPGPG